MGVANANISWRDRMPRRRSDRLQRGLLAGNGVTPIRAASAI